MKHKRLLILISALVLALLITAPVLAGEHEPTGERINIFDSGYQTYPAGEPFHIFHSWITDSIPGQKFFELEVDGVYLKPTYVEFYTEVYEHVACHYRIYYFNFPEGMTGTHVFKGHWILPCRVYLEEG